jgi:hypothetical protein
MKPGGLERVRMGRETRQSILGGILIGYGSDYESLVVAPGMSTLDFDSRLEQKANRA